MSLNFNGNYIGGVPSGGGGGTPYILPVASTTTLGGVKIDGTTINISDGVISSTGLNVDASNLSSNGKKVFDGQWTASNLVLTPSYTAISKTDDATYSLASYLPNDGAIYEVMIVGRCRASILGEQAALMIKSDIIPNELYIAECYCCIDGVQDTGSGTISIPVLTREVIVPKVTYGGGEYRIWCRGYRRIGTNQ